MEKGTKKEEETIKEPKGVLGGCLTTIIIGIVMFIFVIGIIILIGIGLQYVLTVIPCEILVYVETGVLLGVFMLIASLFSKIKLEIKK